MEEIKLRAIDSDNATWYIDFGELYQFTEYELKNWHWSLYTGLKDKNGKKIYENDILKCNDREMINIIIGFNNGAFTVNNIMPIRTLAERLLQYGECEIIGNIHQNPKLIK